MSAHLPNLGQGKGSEGPEARQERGVVRDSTMCRRHGAGAADWVQVIKQQVPDG